MTSTQRAEREDIPAPSAGAISLAPRRMPAPLDVRALMARAAESVAKPAVSAAPAVAKPALAKPAAVVPAKPLTAVPAQAPAETRDREIAFSLLDQAASALPALMTLCQALEAELASTRRRAEADVSAAEALSREWQQNATALQLKVDSLEQGLEASQQRLKLVEERAAGMQDLADQSRHRAAEAECLSSLFHDKVVTALGQGTPAFSVMETFRALVNTPKVS